jgi:hypothetical protein
MARSALLKANWTMIGRKMNTERMGTFLAQVSAAHAQDFIVMVVDGASSHIAKDNWKRDSRDWRPTPKAYAV